MAGELGLRGDRTESLTVNLADRVADTSTTTGTGTLTLSGTAPDTAFPFSSLANGTVVGYSIAHRTLNEVEVGYGTIGAANTLTRDQVIRSSNSNALVNFSAGTKDVVLTISSPDLLQTGNVAAMPYLLR